ncbi:DNA/RNA non-specific endonuclease [Testudinibacter sp. TR-2022]|uniref:DNA/RNA non-specific endonuclease n=1 Tax=Testudinibacter sp. TR-2022 TaxID=2585029 RepID=UPI001118B797|nr:DNA/RNA non-specific endonuclease [Testudinibacter sp. TR-2022]TNH02972.1 hypothetical protein FHQ30_13025 [Pasteurellaceae bacterium Phil11]TNH22375.1 hypothetical protein FHQ29_07595 [Testudinibacter sp. TR-2022]
MLLTPGGKKSKGNHGNHNHIVEPHGKAKGDADGGSKPKTVMMVVHHQKTVGKNDGRLDNDHGRHLIGDQFGGTVGRDKDNLIPMDKDVNNCYKEEYR